MPVLRQAQYSGILFTANFKFLNLQKLSPMQELIDKLKNEAGLSDEQATKAIEAIKSYIVEKFPMFEGAVNSLFGKSE